jgi:hypothetical protein
MHGLSGLTRWVMKETDSPRPMAVLILKHASASRISGEWNDDDYDVLADGAVVGRIMRANAAPVDAPWLWTVTFGHHEDRTPTHGYAVTREAAMTERVKAGGYENRQANRIAMVVAIGGASCIAPVASAQAMNACRTIKDSQKRLACFDAGGRCPGHFAANLRRLSSHGTGRPTRFISAAGKFGPSDRGYL